MYTKIMNPSFHPKLVTAICFLVLIMSSSATFSQDSSGVQRVGSLYHTWEGGYGMSVNGEYAYVATGLGGLSIMDVSDPGEPSEVGFYIAGSAVNSVRIVEQLCYIAGGGVMHILNLENPLNPDEVGSCDTPGKIVGLEGNYAFLVSGDELIVVEITDPTEPRVACRYNLPEGSTGVIVEGNYGYCAYNRRGDDGASWSVFNVLDLSDPERPRRIGTSYGQYGVRHIALVGEICIATLEHNGFHVFDVSDPSHPENVLYYEMPNSSISSLIIDGQYCYVACRTDRRGEIRVLDIEDPTSPRRIGSCDISVSYSTKVLAVVGDLCYINGNGGLQVVDVSNPRRPSVLGIYYLDSPMPLEVAVAGNLCYVGCKDYIDGETVGSLHIVDISEPSEPREVGFCDVQGSPEDVEVVGDYCYMAVYTGGEDDFRGRLCVINVSDSSRPEEVGSYEFEGRANGIVIADNYCYITEYHRSDPRTYLGSLRVLDVSNPSHPRELGVCDTGPAEGVAVSGNFCYVPVRRIGLRVVDVTSPSNPRVMGSCETQSLVYDVAVAGQYCYVACYRDLSLIDVRFPSEPREVGFLDTRGSTITVSDNYAYLTHGFRTEASMLYIVNIGNPLRPSEAGFYNIPGRGSGVAVAGDFAFLAEEFFLGIYECSEARSCRGEFQIDHDSIAVEVELDHEARVRLSTRNEGDYSVSWSANAYTRGNAGNVPWTIRETIPVGEITGDDRIEGVIFDGDSYFCAGSNGNDPNMIYQLSSQGALLDSFPQPGRSRLGFKDLAWDGELIWGSGEDTIYAVNREGEVVYRWLAPFRSTTNIAFDPEEGILWLSGLTTDISAYDRDGNYLGRSIDCQELRIYGLACFESDPDGASLYALNRPGVERPFQISKFNLESGEMQFEHLLLKPEHASSLNGAFMCRNFDQYQNWVLLTRANIPSNLGGDQLQIWQVQYNGDWLTIRPDNGEIRAGSSSRINVNLQSSAIDGSWEFEVGDYDGEIVIYHDGAGGEVIIPVRMTVVEQNTAPEGDVNLPSAFGIVRIAPNPFNSTTTIRYGLNCQSNVTLEVFDVSGRRIKTLVNGRLQPGTHKATLNAGDMASGLYFMKLESSGQMLTRKLMFVK